jgi:hypothetical protein
MFGGQHQKLSRKYIHFGKIAEEEHGVSRI